MLESGRGAVRERLVASLAAALDEHDRATGGHLRRVAVQAVRVAERIGMGAAEIDRVYCAAVLHDLGKIGIPDWILGKRGPLDNEERRLMEEHPTIGARILRGFPELVDVADMVEQHQERWDGRTEGAFRGYPLGLAGEEISLGARIIAAVDAFDAMTSDRPYRCGLPIAEARAVLQRERGGQFDPRVVDVFFALQEEGAFSSSASKRTAGSPSPTPGR
ncbi:MAG: HD-GYP domain-containing protein [Acidobacteriota bacterium]